MPKPIVSRCPLRLVELPSQHLDEVGLDEDHRGELVARVQLELRLIPAREAVVAAVRAAAVGIERPLEEGHALDAIQSRAAAHFLIGGVVGALNRARQRSHTAVFHQVGDLSGGWGPAEVEEQRRRIHDADCFALCSLCQGREGDCPRNPSLLLQFLRFRAGRRRRTRPARRTSFGTCAPRRRGSPRRRALLAAAASGSRRRFHTPSSSSPSVCSSQKFAGQHTGPRTDRDHEERHDERRRDHPRRAPHAVLNRQRPAPAARVARPCRRSLSCSWRRAGTGRRCRRCTTARVRQIVFTDDQPATFNSTPRGMAMVTLAQIPRSLRAKRRRRVEKGDRRGERRQSRNTRACRRVRRATRARARSRRRPT